MTNTHTMTKRIFAGWSIAVLVTAAVMFPGSVAAGQSSTCFSIKTYSPKSGRSDEGQKCLNGFLKVLGNIITFGITTSTCPAESWLEPGGSYCDTGVIYRSCREVQARITIITDKKRCNEWNECVVVGHGTTEVIQLVAFASGQCGGDPYQ